jgi:purine-binding chemotaxis protein CheW
MSLNRSQSIEALTIALEGETFALDASMVREILDPISITEVPGARGFVKGIINVRGKVVPLADLRVRFGMEPKPPTIDTRFVVLEIEVDGDATIVAILADKVHEVTEIGAASLEETPKIGMQWPPEFIRCIGKQRDEFVIIPNIEQIFS